MPISRVRCATAYERTPKIPIAASTSATRGKQRQQRHVEPRLRDRAGDDFLERADVADRQVAVERVDGAPGRFAQGLRAAPAVFIRTDIPDTGHWRVGQIDLRRIRLGKPGVLHVADDADDFSAGASACQGRGPSRA